jgi:hypothetical protein
MSNPNHTAFPLACNYGAGDEVTYGLNKREYFAAMAMQGLLSNPGGPIQANGSTGWGLTNVTWDQVASVAWRAADALLDEQELQKTR